MRWIRRRVGWIAAAAVGGVLLWLVATAATLQVTRAETAGTLFGRPVSADALQQALQAATHDAILSFGDRFRDQTSDAELLERAWERLTLLEEAERKRIRVSDREVVEQLRRMPLFQTSDGRLDSHGYQQIVQYTLGATPRQFEEETRENLAIRKLLQEAIEVPPVTDQEIEEAFRKEQAALQEKEKQVDPEMKPGEEDRKRLREEIASRKRLTSTLAWYQELLKRADRKSTAAPRNP